MTVFRRTLDHARAASTLTAGARPAYAAGVRAAIAIVVPIIADQLLHLGGGTWMGLAGLNSAFTDRGGPYRTRAATVAALAVASAAAVAVATLVSGRPALAVPVALVVAFAGSIARVWGDAATSVGVTALLTFVIALAVPPVHESEALRRALFVLVGGGWYMLLALVFWPLRPYRPVRRAVAACYRALSEYADDVGARARTGDAQDAWEARGHVLAIRQALDRARTELVVSRRGRPAESARGERLLVLHETADQLLVHLIAVADAVEADRGSARDPVCDAIVSASLAAAATSARAIAHAVDAESGTPWIDVSWGGALLRDRVLAGAAPDESRAHYEYVAMLLDRMAEYASTAAGIARGLNDGRPITVPPAMLIAEEPRAPRTPLATLRAALTLESFVLRHAVRVAVVTAAAVWLTGALGLSHGYWVTITAVIIMQPYTGATTVKALQRVAGTVLGGVLAAGLSAVFRDPQAVLVLVFVFTAVCVALLPLNYGAYAVFGTPAFVLLAEVGANDWHLTSVRVLNTLAGGALALAGSRLLRAVPESTRFADYAAATLRANREYLRQAVALVARGAALGTLREARRAVALATANAEDSFQRLVVEHEGPPSALEPLMVVLTYGRRVAASTGALAVVEPAADAAAREALERFSRSALPVLDDLADAVASGRRPAPLPAPDPRDAVPGPESPLLRARLNRILRQLRALHDAVAKWRGEVGRDGATPAAAPEAPGPTAETRSA
jgi:uncharacterized membrane protein YccC